MRTLFSLIIIVFFTQAYADDIIAEMSAVPQSNSILIQFRTVDEEGVKSFILKRSIGDSDNYEDIKEFVAVGHPNDYSYQDEVVWLQKVTTTVVHYKIAIIKSNGEVVFTNSLMVMPNVNEIVKTWGSIKLLFR